MHGMEWVKNVNGDARAAYALTLMEKVMSTIEIYEWYPMVREAINMCWEWVEEKKHSGDELYETVDNEDEDGLIYIEGLSFIGDNAYGPQAEYVWSCAVDAVLYTARQAYESEQDYYPQPVEIVTDEYIDEEFMGKMKKIERFQEKWAERLKQYLLENYPAGSEKKIKREEMIDLI
ncbi:MULTISPECIES: Imm6 family immunity protein [unclassified Thermoactinomyces]|uniref:Imm6 family immunity protein n=1 Tax=unclassified Thermoactinomyces TaxID=2634588 RepID=UPI0018DB2E84|nr:MULTISPECIES: Imm6 family immunity protein [unclassified Thermoactinomyces]MBH8599274.1 hypothetical protein [Thermoactinomyces sp. CICC 10523]MBH8605840.1 hypothetical protein [Thermoactinomyces sp. CICC 10522]MBH8608827.1 hypothetical protein [Thermoactinomyces sp. CICC 10521]